MIITDKNLFEFGQANHDYSMIRDEALKSGMSLSQFYKKNMVLAQKGDSVVVDSQEENWVTDAEYGLGYFPTNAFDLIDRTVHLPIKKYFASDFVPFQTGGGAVETVRAYRAQNAPVEMALASGTDNQVPVTNGEKSTYFVPVYAWKAGIKIGVVDFIKANKGDYSILEHYEESLRDSYWFRIEKSAFIGNVGVGGITTAHADFVNGLLNIPTTQITTIDSNVGGTNRNIEDMDLAQLASFFGVAIQTQQDAVRLNREWFANRAILWPELYAKLVTTPATLGTSNVGVFSSQLAYLEKHLAELSEGDFKFGRLPYVSPNALTKGYAFREAGSQNLGKVLIYRQDPKTFVFPIPMPLTMGALLQSPTEDAYRKNGLTFMSAGILIHYYSTFLQINNVGSEYSVTYELDGGTNHLDNPATFVVGDLPIELKTPTKSDFTFVGWFTEAVGGQQIENLQQARDYVLYAHWEAD